MMKLIEEWRSCWKYLSVQANTIGVAVASTYGLMYDQLKETLPPHVMSGVVAGVFVMGIIGRLVSQAPKDDTK